MRGIYPTYDCMGSVPRSLLRLVGPRKSPGAVSLCHTGPGQNPGAGGDAVPARADICDAIFPHPLRGPTQEIEKNSSEFFEVARPQSKFHFSNLSSLMRRQVLVRASLGRLPVEIMHYFTDLPVSARYCADEKKFSRPGRQFASPEI